MAKELIEKYCYTQKQAAQKLGTTQPAISQYLSSKRGSKGIPNYDEVAPIKYNMDNFNFYYSSEEGEADSAGTPPSGFWTDCSFVDSLVVLHTSDFTDWTSGNHFSAEGYNTKAFLHESGHGIFGLVDEYDDMGRGCITSYSEPDTRPNIWATEDSCRDYAEDRGGTGDWDPDLCNKFTECQGDWWKLDAYDIMVRGLVEDGFGVACTRRINWVFDETEDGSRPDGAYGLGYEEGEEPKSVVLHLNINITIIS